MFGTLNFKNVEADGFPANEAKPVFIEKNYVFKFTSETGLRKICPWSSLSTRSGCMPALRHS
jgi:hypothetical protein